MSTTILFAPLTKEEAIRETYFHEPETCAALGRKREWRRNGQTKTWKRDTTRFALPVKHGLRVYDTITEVNAHFVCPANRCPVCTQTT
jgi:hypothetical protein